MCLLKSELVFSVRMIIADPNEILIKKDNLEAFCVHFERKKICDKMVSSLD